MRTFYFLYDFNSIKGIFSVKCQLFSSLLLFAPNLVIKFDGKSELKNNSSTYYEKFADMCRTFYVLMEKDDLNHYRMCIIHTGIKRRYTVIYSYTVKIPVWV